MALRDKPHMDRSKTFDDFLAEQGMLEHAEEQAIKEIIADQRAARAVGRTLRKELQ